MARFGGQSGPSLQPLPGAHPTLLKRLMMPPVPDMPYEQIFRAEIDTITVHQLDNKFVALLALCHTDAMAGGMLDEYNEPDAFRGREATSDLRRVWKTTSVYEQILEDHPRLVRFDHRDPFFGIPILDMPSTTLEGFLAKHKSTMYDANRIIPKYRPLIYQWALHLISGLSFVHSKDIVFGDLRIEVCWLSKDLSLSLLGFLDAVYKTPGFSRQYINQGGRYEREQFHPCHKPRWDSLLATTQTDLFVWGCLIYQLMTGFWPGYEQQQRSDAETRALFVNRQWPLLETEYLGDIIRKCFNYEYQSAEHLKMDIIQFLTVKGWEVDGDKLCGFRATELF